MDRGTERGAAFQDRADAGRRLGAQLLSYDDRDPFVLALPRGGVAVGYEVARILHAPLDVVVARKLGAPQQPELAIGAIAPRGVIVLDHDAAHYLHVSDETIREIVAREDAEMRRRMALYRGERPVADLLGRTVIVVDDGLATGLTARAAIRSVRQSRPQTLVLAVPVCARETALALRNEVDDMICLLIPDDFFAVGLWYSDFSQLTDSQVRDLLAAAEQDYRRKAT